MSACDRGGAWLRAHLLLRQPGLKASKSKSKTIGEPFLLETFFCALFLFLFCFPFGLCHVWPVLFSAFPHTFCHALGLTTHRLIGMLVHRAALGRTRQKHEHGMSMQPVVACGL